MDENDVRLKNLKPFAKGDARICKNSPGRPKGARSLSSALKQLLDSEPTALLEKDNEETINLAKIFKRKKLIRNSKDLLALQIAMKALKGDKFSINLVISQLGEEKPTKIEIANKYKRVDELSDEQLDSIIRGETTFADYFGDDD
jgi:hypothetical protein